MKKRSTDLIIIILLGLAGLFFYFRTPKSAVILHQQINESNPHNLNEERIKLSEDYEILLSSGVPKKSGASSTLVHYLIGKQRSFLDLRINQAIEEIKNTGVEAGKIRVWSLLNMGVVVKTNHKTIAFDLADLPLSQAHKELSGLADVFITSHPDADHYDRTLLEKALDQGKTLVFPDGFGFKPEKENTSNIYEIKSGEGIDLDGIKITAYQTDHRGNKDFSEPNAWFLVEIDGFKLLHTGDGLSFRNEKEMERLNARKDIDLFLVNIMIQPFNIRDIKPKVMVPLHLYKFVHNREQLKESTFTHAINIYNQYDKDLTGIEKMLLLAGESFIYPY